VPPKSSAIQNNSSFHVSIKSRVVRAKEKKLITLKPDRGTQRGKENEEEELEGKKEEQRKQKESLG